MQALDGLYIRIAVPALSALVLLPLLVWAVWPAGPEAALGEGALLLLAATGLPALAARGALELGGQLAEAGAGLRVAALDAVTGLREVRAFGAEGRDAGARAGAGGGAVRRPAATGPARGGGAGGRGAVRASGAAAGAAGRAAGGTPGARGAAGAAAFEIVGAMPRAGVLLGLAAAAARRIVGAADAAPAVPEPEARLRCRPGHALRFENVRFAYPGRGPVLQDVSLEIPEGARVAILGPSGAGKSTLAALALRLLAPQAGRVTLGGVDVRRIAVG